ncbi:MAG: dihydrodipicolinate synthase family protein [Microbacteriaceae bacterium]|nr:dihydrodipicolinate synthase family protein [Microbacteriaceae bacterium]MCL2793750.1 dihydrodipicolinate synthase family protein [Microbacteriaceae bacterium]
MTTPSDFQLICAPVTAFAADGSLDIDGTRALFAALRAAGVDGVFTPGTTGEFTALDDDERLAIIEAALEVFGQQGVVAHVGAASARQAVRLARAAHAAGATRFAAITPYFMPAGAISVRDYYAALADALPGASLYVYLFASRAVTTVNPAELATLAELPGVVGVKVSGLSLAENLAYLTAAPEGFEYYSGSDADIVRLAAAGASGIVSGISTLFPETFVSAARAIRAGADASVFQSDIDAAAAAASGAGIGLMKTGLAQRGLAIADTVRVAIEPPTPDRLAALRDTVERLR